MKKIFSLFAALTVAVCAAWAETETLTLSTEAGIKEITVTSQGTSGEGGNLELSKGNVTVTSAKGYFAGSGTNGIQIYGGGTMTVRVPSAYSISSISMQLAGSCYPFSEAPDEAWNLNKKNQTDGQQERTFTITSAASSITFTNTVSGQTKVKKLVVTYALTSSDPVINTPASVTIESNATSGEFAYTITNPAAGVNPTAIKTVGDWMSNVQVDATNKKITFDAEANATRQDRTATIKISYDGAQDKEVTVTQKGFQVTELVDVTGAMTWDFSGYTKDVTTDKDVEVILGNYITLNTGNADALKGKQQYIVRNNYCWQGTDLVFHPTVTGVVEVEWCSTSGSNYRTLAINGVYADPTGYNSVTKKKTSAFVPANEDVVLTGWAVSGTEGDYTYSSNQIRIWTVKFTPADQVTISAAGYATYFNADNAVELPTGVEGYVWEDGLVKVYDAATTEKVVPAGEPVVLKAAAGTYSLKYTTTETPSYKEIDSNDLQGAATAMTAAEMVAANPGMGKFYALSLNAEGKEVGFYWINEGGAAFDISAGKAYLALPAGSGAPARFVFGQQDVPTEVVNVNDNNQSTKVLRDGRLYILRDGNLFDLNGRLVK